MGGVRVWLGILGRVEPGGGACRLWFSLGMVYRYSLCYYIPWLRPILQFTNILNQATFTPRSDISVKYD